MSLKKLLAAAAKGAEPPPSANYTLDFTPQDLGLPPKFTAYRAPQLEALNRLITLITTDIPTSNEEFTLDPEQIVIPAPTGVGKTLIYISLAKWMIQEGVIERALVLVASKSLQDQIVKEMSAAGVVSIKGSANYQCPHFGDCKQGGKSKCELIRKGLCSSLKARSAASKADVVVPNYAYWLTIGQHSPDLIGRFDLIIMDEAHQVEGVMTKSLTIDLTQNRINLVGKASLQKQINEFGDDVNQWASWANAFVCEGKQRLQAIKTQPGYSPSDCEEIEEVVARLGRLASITQPEKWVVECGWRQISFIPVWPREHAQKYLFREAQWLLATSATITPKASEYFGFDQERLHEIAVRSSFDQARRPIYYCPVASVDSRTTDGQWRAVSLAVDRIAKVRLELGRRGLVHTVAHSRTVRILEQTRLAEGVFIGNTMGANLKEVMGLYLSSDDALVLCSASVPEGHDFPHDAARWQVVLKVPFFSVKDPVIKARQEQDEHYSIVMTANILFQMFGRVMRAGDDWGETIIVDKNFGWFKKKKLEPLGLWPKMFEVQHTKSLPMPMEVPDKRE